MEKDKQKKINKPKSVRLEIPKKVANKPLVVSTYKPIPRFNNGCPYC